MSMFYPTDYGAVADGEALHTEAIQRCIDACHGAGGGTVVLPTGVLVTGTLILKSNVQLEIPAGAVLRASADLAQFPSVASRYPSYDGEYVTHKALIRTEDAEKVSITGLGTIDGGGDAWVDGPYGMPSFSLRPRILYFRGCRRVRVRDVTLRNAASWVQTYQDCRDVGLCGITVESRENPDIEAERYAKVPGRNTDGLDIVDCQSVTVSDCRITTGDDGICLKSYAPDGVCRDIAITNCIVSTNASGIKIGTETSGAITDVVISNCVVHDTRCDGIAVMTVDGALVERISISGITLRNIKGAPIYIRCGARGRVYRQGAVARAGILRDVRISNVQGAGLSAAYASSITGLPGQPVEGVFLQGVNLEAEGGFESVPAGPGPDVAAAYPGGKAFGPLPAYGFYVRHARDIAFEQVSVRTRLPDARPMILVNDRPPENGRTLCAPLVPGTERAG